MEKTENKLAKTENEEVFKLHIYDEHLNPEYFALNIQAISESYEIMCKMYDVSLKDHPLKVLKIESGSLFAKFLGYIPVLDSLSLFMKKTVELIFNKFTFEGKVLRTKQVLDLIEKHADIIEKYSELGIDLADENIQKYNYQLVKSIGKLVVQTTKVKINDEELSLEGHYKQKYLDESQKLLITDSEIQENLEEITIEGTGEPEKKEE